MNEPKAFASLSSGLLARKGSARPAMRPQGFGQVGSAGLDDLGWNDMGFDSNKPSLTPVRDASDEDGGDDFHPHAHRNPLAGLTPASPVHSQHAEIEERFTAHDEEGEDENGDYIDETAELYEPEEEEVVRAKPFAKKQALDFRRDDDDQVEDVADEFDTLELSDAFEPGHGFGQVEEYRAPVAFDHDEAAETEDEPVALVAEAPRFEPEAPRFVAPVAPAPFVAPTRARRPRAEAGAKGKAAFTLRLDPARHLKLRLACAVSGRSAQQLVTDALDRLLAEMPELESMAERAPKKK